MIYLGSQGNDVSGIGEKYEIINIHFKGPLLYAVLINSYSLETNISELKETM